MERTQFPAQAICAATDRQGRVVAYAIEKKSFDRVSFLAFLKQLRQKVKRKKFNIFLDGCSTHHTAEVSEYCRRSNINLIFNSAHSPEFNPIERLWWLLKKIIRKLALKSEKLTFKAADIKSFITKALRVYSRQKLAAWTELTI